MAKLRENARAYAQHVQFHETLKHSKKSKFRRVLPPASSQEGSIHQQHSSTEHAGKRVENWFQFFPCCPGLRCASQCTVLSGRWAVTSLWLKRDVNTEELNRQSSDQWYGNWESTAPLFPPIWAMTLRFCYLRKRRKKKNGAKDCTQIKHQEGTRDSKNINTCPGRLLWSQLTCPYVIVATRSQLWLPLFSSSLLLPLQYFLTFHFFSWPSKHCKFGIDNNWFWLFYFRTKFTVNIHSYFAKIVSAYTLKTKKRIQD